MQRGGVDINAVVAGVILLNEINQFRCFISCVPNNKSVKIETTTTGAIAVSVSALPQQTFDIIIRTINKR